ncbi:unnamed protein product [Dovyalis caffra]|uniref:PWI domain-containing protein n=1 Tax=Dovyalis caffra TaxID=77055 RepID=A0AAV1QUM1_9ROSI|nr:unnamed protein product [Dovyalis caffra]
MGFESNHDLKRWVSDKLMSLLGYSHANDVSYVIGLSKQVNSPADLLTKLQDFGVSCSTQAISFAEELFVRVLRKDKDCGLGGGGGGSSVYQDQEKQAALIARKQRTYSLILDDDHDQEEVEERPVKRRVFPDDHDCDHDAIKFKKWKKMCNRSEKEPLQQNVRKHDAPCKQKSKEPKLNTKVEETVNLRSDALGGNDVDALRAFSRQKYVKKREQKKLEEIREDREDEQYLFDDVKFTEAEYSKFRYKKEMYELVKKKRSEGADDTEYRMPEAYDQEGCVDQEKRFSVALQRGRDPIAGDQVKPFAEQEAWEDCQIQKATLNFHSRNQKKTSDDYQFVFEDQVELIKMDSISDNFDDKLQSKSLHTCSRKRSAVALPTIAVGTAANTVSERKTISFVLHECYPKTF